MVQQGISFYYSIRSTCITRARLCQRNISHNYQSEKSPREGRRYRHFFRRQKQGQFRCPNDTGGKRALMIPLITLGPQMLLFLEIPRSLFWGKRVNFAQFSGRHFASSWEEQKTTLICVCHLPRTHATSFFARGRERRREREAWISTSLTLSLKPFSFRF